MRFEGSSLLIRADASTHIGMGHLMRCLALAQAWKNSRYGDVIFITACGSNGLAHRLLEEGCEVVKVEGVEPGSADLKSTLQVLAEHPHACVVLDGYHFDSFYQSRIKEIGHPLLVIDDSVRLDYYYADALLDQNINANKMSYPCDPGTRQLLGTRYALLRSEFLAWRSCRREVPRLARRLLVTLGGSDPDNVTLKIIKALQQLTELDMEAKIVVGPANCHLDALRQAVQSSTHIRLLTDVNSMPELMAWAQVAVSACGSTCWELAFMGLPNLILVMADNQQGIALGIEEQGAAYNLGWHAFVSEADVASAIADLMCDHARRRTMSEWGRQLVDGHGAERVATILAGQSR